jgi:predicted nucleotidyltransferase
MIPSGRLRESTRTRTDGEDGGTAPLPYLRVRLRRLVWETAGPAVGRAAPRAAHAYYDAVAGSLARSLLRIDGVRGVYAAGSYATGALTPGRSDVDLVAAIDAPTPEEHLRLLRAARGAYRRHQAILPVDLALLPAAGFRRAAAVHALFRRRIAAPEPRHPVDAWRLLAGAELRGAVDDPPDPRLFRLTDSHVLAASARLARGDGDGVLAELATTAKDLAAEGIDAAPLGDDPGRALEAAFALVVAHREREALPAAAAPPDLGAWRAPAPTDAAVEAARALVAGAGPLRSATAYAEPFTGRPRLLLEAPTPRDAVALAQSVQARDPRAAGTVAVLPTALAEDPWATSLRAVAIAAGGRHVAGEPLAPRLRHGPPAVRSEHARIAVAAHWWRFEAAAIGRRFTPTDATIVLRLASHAVTAAGGPALAEQDALAGAVPALEGRGLAQLAALDRDALALLALRLARQTSATPPARIRSGSMSR